MPLPAPPVALTKPRLLIGEGQDEVFFFEAMLAHHGVADVHVEQYAGKGKLSVHLRDLVNRPGWQGVAALAVTRDADADAAQAFASVSSSLAASGLPGPPAAGQVAVGPPRVGVFLLPDNRRAGMLEDLCWEAVQTDGAALCVDDYLRCVAQRAARQPNVLAKARIHAWLTSHRESGLRLGEAAKNGYLPWGCPELATLEQFVTSF
jgi:hypothetical protein